MQKPEPKLAHMPENIKQLISDSAPDIRTKFALYQVSKEFQSTARKAPITYNHFKVELQVEKIKVSMEVGFLTDQGPHEVKKTLVMEFLAHEKGALRKNPTSNWEKILPRMDYRKAAVQYLLAYMGPKTKVEKFTFQGDKSLSRIESDKEDRNFPAVYPKKKFEEDRKIILDEIERAIQAKRRQLLVGTIEIRFWITTAHIVQILRCLKAGTLTNIVLKDSFPTICTHPKLDSLEQIFEMPQWKQAKCVDLEDYDCNIPVEQWAHFTKLRICQRRPSISVKTIVEAFLNFTSLKELWVHCIEDFDETHDANYYLEQLNLRADSIGIYTMPDKTYIRVYNPRHLVRFHRH